MPWRLDCPVGFILYLQLCNANSHNFPPAINEETFTQYQKRIIENFPVSAAGFQGSTAYIILERLSNYLFSREGTTAADHLMDCKSSIRLAAPILNSLATNIFDPEEPPPFPIKLQNKRRNTKSQSQSHIHVIDITPYVNLGVPVPRYAKEAEELTEKILDDQRGVLEV
jgi:hypothetical protein